MVNLEPGRDYYADLELAPSADINEVRKQFRKLALKYHPDRHPGEEAAYNSKFQAISAANEILTDPALRAKFDAQRLREGPPKHSSVPHARPNVPPRTRTTNFPPPPRPPPPSANKSTFSPPPSAGGQRKYEKPLRQNPSWGPIDPDEAKTKANDFKAWEQMRHGQGPILKTRPLHSRAPMTAAFESERTSPPRKAPDGLSSRARRRWEDLLDAGMSNIGRYSGRSPPPPKRSSHGHKQLDEDELQGKPSAYNVFKGDYPKRTTDMPPPPARYAHKPDQMPLHAKEPYAQNSARVRAPHLSTSNEKMKTASPGLQRSTTSAPPRDAKPRPTRPNADSLPLERDHIRTTSADATHRHQAFRPARRSSSTTSETTSSASSDAAGSEQVFGKTQADRQRRIPKSRKPRQPAGAGLRLKSGFSPHYREDEGQPPRPGYSDLRRHSGIDLPTRNAFGPKPESLHAHRMGHGASQTRSPGPNMSANEDQGDHFPQRHRSFDGRYHFPHGVESPQPSQKAGGKSPMYGSSGFQSMADNTKTYNTPPPPPFRSQSSETITTKFSAVDSPPKFGDDNIFANRRSSQYDSDNTADPSESQARRTPATRAEADRSAAADIPPPPKVGDKWSSEDWEKRFGTHTFEIPAKNASSRATSHKRPGTPRQASLNNLKRTGTLRSNGFQPTVIDHCDEPSASHEVLEELDREASNFRPSNASDGSAMDIDSALPAAESRDAEGEVSPTTSVKDHAMGTSGPKKDGILNNESDSSKINLSGFRHVAPFSSSHEGLNGIEDLKSALPFESRPSPTKPDFAKCYEKLVLPNPPRAPSPPGELGDMEFAGYVSAMNHYMYNWNNFSTQTIMLFQRRQEEHREIGQGWIGQVGGDCDAYLHALEEDERGRLWWATACEKHKAVMQNLKSVREKMLKAKGNA